MPQKADKLRKGEPGFMKEIAASGSKGGKVPGFMQEMAEERKGEPARETKEQKAAKLTRLMKKGYRKGYRVGKRPDNKPRNPFRSSSRKSSGR